MGSPSSGSRVQKTMSLTRGKHQQSRSAGASLQLEKLGQLENSRSAEKLSSCAALSPRTPEEQSIPGDKNLKRRTRSSQGLELNCVPLGTEEKKPFSSVSFGGQRRSVSGSVTPKGVGSPRAKGMCSSPGVDKYAVAKIAASLFHSSTNLEQSVPLSRVAHRVVPDAGGRTRTGGSEVDNRDTLAELNQQVSQRELERLQAVVAHRGENGSSRNECSQLLEKKVKGDKACRNQTNAVPFSCNGSGAPLAVTGAMSCATGDDENSHPKAAEVPMISVGNPSHGTLASTENSWPKGGYLSSNAAHLPVKDIHPVCFETTNKLRTEQVPTVSTDMGYDLLPEITRSSSLSTVASTHQAYLSRDSNYKGPELAGCEPLFLEQQSEHLSNETHPENTYRINHPDMLPTSNSCPAGIDLSCQDIKEVTLPGTSEAFETNVLVCNQGSEMEKKAHSVIAYSSDKVDEAGLTKAEILSSLVCEKDSVLVPEESKQVVIDESQGKEVKEFHFSAEKEVDLRKINGSESCLRKSTSFELGEKKTKVRKRRRSVSASGIGAMLLKIVRTSEPESIGGRSLPRAESEVSGSSPLPPTANLHQCAPFETETNNTIEAVDMDVEYEDCSSELADTAIACNDASVEVFSENKDTKRPSEGVKLQLVDETQSNKIKNYTEGQAKLVSHNSQEEDQIAGSGSRSFNDECDKRVISLVTTGDCNSHSAITADSDPCEEQQQLGERFLDARDKSLDRNSSFESIEASSPIAQAPKDFANQALVVKENAKMNGHSGNMEDSLGGSQRRRRNGGRGRMSHDFDSSTVAIEESRRSLSLVDENLCMITSPDRSRSFASMLQVSPRQSIDDPTHSRLPPSSISILTNPSFSSSHQDRLWEEQAEYSSGGRGTPSRDDDDEAAGNHTPSSSAAISSDDQLRSTGASMRRSSQEKDTGSLSCSGFASDSGRSHEKRKMGQFEKKRRQPQRSPLHSLLAAEDLQDEPPANQRSPERHHFLKQILSRIRGKSSSPKSSPHKPRSQKTPKRRNSMIWGSCLCFSHVNYASA
ncbi:hypothetical protein KC19_5G068200 [Ceratodon purpureus]|uniref:Uncharacterized protein n=1 Tax=Ceratodon purpureus TaxID=3225 RepID=A0A8T0HZS2_CERPU|nr:hypothetical protein KC19_5G068200 [Ceratodon purpureus]